MKKQQGFNDKQEVFEMLSNSLVLGFCAAFCFAVWPMVARAGAPIGSWLTVMVATGTFTVGLIFSLGGGQMPSWHSMLIGIGAGLINGIGMVAYTKMISSASIDMSKAISIPIALIPVIALVGSFLFFGEAITAKKICGIATAGVAVYLLS